VEIMMKKLNYQSIKFKLKYLLTLFIPVVVIGSCILLLLKSKDIKNNSRQIKAIEKIKVEKINNVLLNDISSTSSDLMYLSENLQLKRYLNGQINDLSDIEKEFLSFSENKKLYGQIRYIDESGMEKIRINYNKGDPYIVRRENLQNKLSRYYFKDTIKLNKKDIFLSKFDLNIENGKVELPFNPTLRFATPVFDQDGGRKGIVIFNFFGEKLLSNINKKLKNHNDLSTFLVDDHSYYLRSFEDHKEWGFMFEDKQNINFKNDSPEVWKEIQNNSSGSIYHENILFTYNKIYPNGTGNKNYYWVIFTKSDISKFNHKINLIFFERVLALTILALLLSIIYSSSKYSEYEYSRMLLEKNEELFYNSTMDKLTNIYNRNHLIELFTKEFSKCLRHNSDLVCLIIDLDHFKKVNDTYGHLAGDYVLKTVSELIKKEVRNEDIFGRYGGDEFLLILPHTTLDGGNKVAEKIKNKIEENQFKIKGINFHVTFSVGISQLDQSMKNIDDLIEKADISLYKSKEIKKACDQDVQSLT